MSDDSRGGVVLFSDFCGVPDLSEVEKTFVTYGNVIELANSVSEMARNISVYHKFQISSDSDVLKLFAIENGELVSFQCLFFENNFLTEKLEKSSLKRLVEDSNNNNNFLIKIELCWNKGINQPPELGIFSSLMTEADKDFLTVMLKSLINLLYQQ